jgi:hypothetical protein
MVAPVQKDSLTDYQVALATILRITSPVSGMFTGNEIKPNPDARSIMVPDIRVDDYIVDAELGRIGADHYSGSEFTSEWKNGLPPIEWRRYSMSRHRAFGFTVFDEQLRYSPIKNLPQEYTARKMQTTVLRDHDKYCLFAALSGHMTGKCVPRTAADTVAPFHADAARISHTADARDYKWIAEPGEDNDNQIQPSFATITGMALDATNPLATVDALTLLFSDNWFDSNFGNGERFLLVTSALELAFINYLIDKGAGTESAFKLLKDGDISGANAAGYLGTLKGSWKLQKIHPEFLPRLFTDASFVIDPVATTSTANRFLRQVVGLAAYKNAIQVYEHFSERRQADGGTRFKGTEYVQDFSYDAWAIDQLSEGIVPLFLPGAIITTGTEGAIQGTTAGTAGVTPWASAETSFEFVAAKVAAARSQLSVSPVTYPLTGPDTLLSRPEWFHQPYQGTTALDVALTVQETGDVAHRNPVLDGDVAPSLFEFEEVIEGLTELSLDAATARADSTAVTLGQVRKYATPVSLWEVTTAGTTAAAQPDISDSAVDDSLTDGTAVLRRVL